ncbi:hypothetical protein HYH02_015554 [Chlamydomonas schloesseri]|uniref:Uncharacterized protein n=1 Tax=Chlamydomonas schloesseri TaxID=2026947 RepID=A0A835SKF6_9CHLO|nr:hypothetical protein HYH02_015554 [Chlamydomonas schloesseri]|eukprot:KAG2421985.1 hypothetical protein HYH02_015554 [Chlamydomonas schloesseri]
MAGPVYSHEELDIYPRQADEPHTHLSVYLVPVEVKIPLGVEFGVVARNRKNYDRNKTTTAATAGDGGGMGGGPASDQPQGKGFTHAAAAMMAGGAAAANDSAAAGALTRAAAWRSRTGYAAQAAALLRAHLLSTVTEAAVASDIVWAAGAGGAAGVEMLTALVDFCAEAEADVPEDGLRQLAAAHPALMAQLYTAGRRAAKRART